MADERMWFTRPRRRWLVLALAAGLLLGGCSWFGGDEEAASEKTGEEGPKEERLVGEGMLDTIFAKAPPGSTTKFLAQVAAQLGWEEQVAQHTLFKKAVDSEDWEEQVEPFLLGLFFQNGFSVLPTVGENHQFARDSVVRGAVQASRLLVTNRESVRIIFLKPVQNLELVYYQDGQQPQIFTVDENAVISVRRSMLQQYLR